MRILVERNESKYNRWKDIHVPGSESTIIKITRMYTSAQLHNKFIIIFIKITNENFFKYWKLSLKFIWKFDNSRITNVILKIRERLNSYILIIIFIKCMEHWYKDTKLVSGSITEIS